MSARRSLHFGANYPGTSAELAGCVNDAEDWALAAHGLGYLPALHREPTRETLLKQLTDAVTGLRYRDRLLVTYSGHGTWVPDRDGDEPDGRDEALVPVDYRTAGLVLDDHLHAIWQQVPFGARVVFVSDSCHSGSVSRFMQPRATPVVAYGVHRDLNRARFLSPIEVLPWGSDVVRIERAAALPVTGTPRPSRVALLSGCRDDEVSYDAHIGGRPRGAASWAYLDALQVLAGSGRPSPSLRTWHAAAADIISRSPYSQQHPQLQASTWQQRTWTL